MRFTWWMWLPVACVALMTILAGLGVGQPSLKRARAEALARGDSIRVGSLHARQYGEDDRVK